MTGKIPIIFRFIGKGITARTEWQDGLASVSASYTSLQPASASARSCAASCRTRCRWRRRPSAGEWGAWGRLSDDGPGHYNPDRSEGPGGKRARPLERRCASAPPLGSERGQDVGSGVHEGRSQTAQHEELVMDGKAPPTAPASKRNEKPKVRNFRGSDAKRRHQTQPGPRLPGSGSG